MSGTRFDVIRAVGACYAGCDDAAWLRGLVDALDTLGPEPRAFGQLVRPSPGGPRIIVAVATGAFAPALRLINEEGARFARAASTDVLRRMWATTPSVDYATRRAARAGAPAIAYCRSLLQGAGEDEALLVLADDGNGTTVVLGRGIRGGARISARTSQRLTRFAAHVGSALRLRRAFLAARGDGAAGLLRRADRDETLRVWQGLVDGTWSLVDRWKLDGRRYALLRRNEPGIREPKALTVREGSVLAYAALGHQNKAIGYLLGLSPSAVASHLASAQRKLGLASRAELIGLFGTLFSSHGER